MSAHLETPLEVVGNLVRTALPQGGCLVAECFDPADGQPHTDASKAYARLFSFAPALLAEVKRLQAESDQLCADMLGITVAQLVAACEQKPGGDRDRTLALIAKAEGRA